MKNDMGVRAMRMDRREETLCIQLHALTRWVARHLGTVEHEQRVTAIASTLFDLTGPLHRLADADRRLLRMAAVVHDVGRAVDDDTHPVEGARMLRNDPDLPLSGTERRSLAFLTRYHKGRVPPAGYDEILRGRDDHERLRLLLSLLRAADALDSRSLDSPRLVFAREGRRLRITCYLDRDCPKARKVYARRKKFRLIEELLNCRVEVMIDTASSLRMVA